MSGPMAQSMTSIFPKAPLLLPCGVADAALLVWPFGQDAGLRGASGLMCSGMSGEGRGGFCFVRYAEEAMAAECVAKAPPSLYLY